jgi:hypothetical protein
VTEDCLTRLAGVKYSKADHILLDEKRDDMPDDGRLKYLRIALRLVGVIFLVGIYPLMIIWPSGWAWHTGHSDSSDFRESIGLFPLKTLDVAAELGLHLTLGYG